MTEAKQLIQSAGATGAKVKLLFLTYGAYPTTAQIVQNQLDAIGLDVQIMAYPPGATFRVQYQQSAAATLLGPTSISVPDTSQILDSYVIGINNPGTKDPTLVASIRQAENLTVGSSQRIAAMQAINQDLMSPNDMLWVAICQRSNIWVGTKKVIGLNTMPFATLSAGATISNLQIPK